MDIQTVLSESDIINRIEHGEPFSAQIDSQAFEIKIDRYVPCICTALHHGHRICSSLTDDLLVTEAERQFEEDPFTGDFIDALPISIKVNDSRYFYDLNRCPSDCVYREAWGKKVWKRRFDPEEIEIIKDLHRCYYRILHSLVGQLEQRFSRSVLYDLHSYNYSRINGNPPLFNIGTHFINRPLFAPIINHLRNGLEMIRLPGLESSTAFDEVFDGKGYQAVFMKENHPDSLCIPLEIKKIFMNEQRFERDDTIFFELKRQLEQLLKENAARFERDFAHTCQV